MRRRRQQAGVGMVEFALVIPLVLLILFGVIDFGRFEQANNSITDASRQGARQAVAAATSSDSPFTNPPSGKCSGQVATTDASIGTGCLTDAAILATVKSTLNGLTASVDSPVYDDKDLAACRALTPPAIGHALVCVSPAETGASTSSTWCSTKLSRQSEWQNRTYTGKNCFFLTVTIVYSYRPWTPVISNIVGTTTLIASTTMLAEY